MAYLHRKRYGLQEFGQTTNIPDSDIAHLMYYLDCVYAVVDCNPTAQMKRLCQYQQYRYLSAEDIVLLTIVCSKLDPIYFVNKVFFRSDQLCGAKMNRFLKLSEVDHQFLIVPNAIAIAGRSIRVKRIMVYKSSWMSRHYYGPLRRLSAILARNL